MNRKQPCQHLHRGQNPKTQDLHSVSLAARLLNFFFSCIKQGCTVLSGVNQPQAPLFVFYCCGPDALRSSCIIEILVAALIIFHANLVSAQHLRGV